MLLKLSYNTVSDKHKYITVIGSPEGISGLLWQLTKNHKSDNGTRIDTVKVTDLNGNEVSHDDCIFSPYTFCTTLD